jgi:hypothetical protein
VLLRGVLVSLKNYPYKATFVDWFRRLARRAFQVEQ